MKTGNLGENKVLKFVNFDFLEHYFENSFCFLSFIA